MNAEGAVAFSSCAQQALVGTLFRPFVVDDTVQCKCRLIAASTDSSSSLSSAQYRLASCRYIYSLSLMALLPMALLPMALFVAAFVSVVVLGWRRWGKSGKRGD